MTRTVFVGHFAAAFVAKRAEPRLGLPLLFVAAQFVDLLWPAFVLLGLEHARIVPGITQASPLALDDMPYSHSLLAALIWSALLGAPWWFKRDRRAALIVAACVFSHYWLDVLSHRPDMPLAPGFSTKIGLGLWNVLIASLLVEGTLFLGSVWLYARATKSTRLTGSVGLWAFVVTLTGAWLVGTLGPAPPHIEAVTITALLMAPVLLVWAHVIDRGRVPRRASDGPDRAT